MGHIEPTISADITVKIPKFKIEGEYTYKLSELNTNEWGTVSGDYKRFQNSFRVHASRVYDPGLALTWYYNKKYFDIECEDLNGRKMVFDCYISNFDELDYFTFTF